MSSLMSNFDTAREALETSLNSSGSAMKEHEKWSQSLEAQILKLKAAWQGLSQAFLSSDFLKVALNAVISLVDGLAKLIDTIGAIPALLTAFAGFKGIIAIPKLFATINKYGGLSNITSLSRALVILRKVFPTATSGALKLSGAFKKIAGASASAGGGITGLFSIIGQHPIIAAAVVAVTALTAAFMYQKKKAEDLANAVEETVSSYKEQHNQLKKLKNDYDASNESSMISKYEKLSKGVDNLGRNVSLTADEYSEYQNIVNQIAEQIPSLVSGYDEHGNAILSCKGNVEELTVAYEKLIHAQNQEILTNTGNIKKNFENVAKDAGDISFWEMLFNWDNVPIANWFVDGKRELATDAVKQLENLLDNPNWEISGLTGYDYDEIIRAFENAGITEKQGWFETSEDFVKRIAKDNPEKIRGIVAQHYEQFAEIIDQQKTIATAKLSEAFDISSSISGLNYGNISEELQSVAYQTVNSLDFDFFSNLSENGKTVEQWTKEMLNQLNSISKVDNAQIEAAFDLQTKFNGGDISYGEYVKSLRDVESTIDELNLKGEAKEQLKISLGLDDDGVVDQYDALVKRLTSKEIGLNDKAAKNFLNSLSTEELDVLVDIIPNLDAGATIDEIKSLIDEKLAVEFTFDISVETAGIEALNTALSEARSATGLTTESIDILKGRYQDLKGFNAGALFERTANGVRLNNEELARLESQYENVNKLDIDKNLSKLVEKYQNLTEEIKTCTDAQEKESMQLQADAYADKIEELQTLAAQYDGLTSSFSKWQQAQSSPNDGDNYDSVFESLEALQESYKAGLVGTDDFRTAVQLMSNEDLSTASVDKLVSVYKDGLPKMQRYFTEGQKGCKNFLNDVNKLNSEWAHLNEKGEWEIDINVEEAAEKLNMDVSTIYLILDKLKDYGFEINIQDTSLKTLQTDIQKSEARLKELGQTPHHVNLDASDIKTIDAEIESLKTHINDVKNDSSISVDAKTAQLDDARLKLEALIQKKQEASQPAFMNLDTSQVKSSMVKALGYVQEYQNSLNDLNMLLELKEAGITIDDSEIDTAQQKLDECAKSIQSLDSEVKLAIGLEEDASIDEIKTAITNGDIVIDTDTSTANVKIKKLADDVERIKDKDVTINVTVNGLDDVKELNKQIDLATKIEGSIDKLSEYVEGAKALSELDDNITSYVTANIDGNVTDLFMTEGQIDNLKVFAEGAKELKGIGSFSSKVTANVDGNVIEKKDKDIDNLKVFSDSAKEVGNIGDVSSSVTADVKGSVVSALMTEERIDNLKVFSDNAKEVHKIGDVESSVEANIDGNVKDLLEIQIDNLKVYSDSAKEVDGIGDVKSSVTADIDGNVKNLLEVQIDNLKAYSDNAKKVESIGEVNSSVTANINGNVKTLLEEQIDNLKVYSDNAKEIGDIGDVESKVTADVKGNVKDLFEEQIDNLKVYSDSAKEVENIGDVSSKTTVDVKGNIVNLFDGQIDNIKIYSDSAKEVESIGDISSSVRVDVKGNVKDLFEEQIDNLKVYSDNAKEVDGIGDISSSVSANIKGDVVWTPEGMLNNLKEFAEGARELENTSDVSRTIEANVNGDAVWHPESMLNNLNAFAEGAKELENISDVSRKITANIDGDAIWHPEGMLDNLKEFAEGAKVLEGIPESISRTVTANIDGDVAWHTEGMLNNVKVFAESAKALDGVGSPSSTVTANINGNVTSTSEGSINKIGTFADNAKKAKGIGNFTSSVTASVGGNIITDSTAVSDLEHFVSVASGMSNQTVSVNVTANVDSTNINSAIDLLTKAANSGVFKDYKATVQVGAKIATIDDTTVKNYKVPKKEGIAAYKVDSSKVDSWKAPSKDGVVNYSAEVEALTSAQKHKTGTITYKANIVGLGSAAGTAHASGSAKATGTSCRAFARGDWGIKGNGVALGGELGREVVVRDGKFFTVGDEGAQFFRYKKNDIVFNAAQTEALFKYGGLKGANPRGKMLATGSAFANGSVHPSSGKAFAVASGGGKFVNPVTGGKFVNPVTGEEYGSSSDSSSDKDFEEVIDWIEVIIDRVERAIDKFDQQANNIYKSWSSRNNALQNQISEVSKEIGLQQQAYNKYMSAANGVGLSSSWASKVRNGEIDIDTIKDETLADKIKSYQDYYEKALDAKKAIEELREEESKLYAQRVENISTQYDGILGVIEHEKNMLEEYISQSEAQGWFVSANYYNALASNEKDNIAQLKKEKAAMLKELQTAMESGTIAKGSEAWYEMVASIDEVSLSIAESETALKEYSQTIQQLSWETFDILQDRISAVTEEADFLIELMSSDKLYDDSGKLTDEGKATMGLHGQNYNVYMAQADKYADEIAKLDKEIAKDPYDQDLINRRQEMLELQQESILAAQQEKEAIRDMVSDGIEIELNALQELIDKKNEALESERDLYEYQKKVKEQTEEIASLEKQMVAYSGDDSEEAQQKIQQIKVDLETARQDLQETEYDKFISDSSALLDELYLEYEEILNMRLDNLDALVSDVVAEVNANATTISTTISEKADSVGYELSSSMQTIWNASTTDTTNVITTYGEKFSTAQTTTNKSLSTINANLQNMITQLNKLAKTNVESASISSAANSKEANTNEKKSTTETEKEDAKEPKKTIAVGGKINASGAQIYDYAGDTSGERQLYRDDPIYTVLKMDGNWVQVRYHKLSSGVTGWFKKGDVKAYATGKKNFLDDEIAWTQDGGREFIVRPSDGAILTPVAKGDSVLTSAASNNIWDMANSPAEFIKDNLNLGSASVPNNSNVSNSVVQHFENITFSMPNVHGYNELLTEMQRDPKFEKLVLSMTVDRIAGKSSLAKGKSIR